MEQERMNSNMPEISIVCNTYNQGKYIKQALDGFIMQSGDIPFEILVHDDASTDDTVRTIREYEERYPDIVFPIYEEENQYSKGIKITPQIQLKRTRGKYIAFCEGDDYWTDPQKLQIQYTFMETHPEYSICCHAYGMVDKEGKLIEERHDFNSDGIVPIERLIGNQLLVPHFATMLVRKECLADYGPTFLDTPCNDMTLRLYCQCKNPIYYINRNMSCYRRFTENSWTLRVGYNQKSFLSQQKRTLAFLRKYDEFTKGIYSKEIDQECDRRTFEIALMENDYKTARASKAYKDASLKRKTGIIIGCLFPHLTNIVRKI